ncbi:MAG: response regulator [Thermodesulfobacteriota bacterium]|nr:response regulator [Thermodesulfobacteriota bacterium]
MSQEPILVVDDEATVRMTISETIRMLGYDCRTAADGQVALNMIKGNGFDLVISDICMPGIDGLELIEKARETRPGIPFIMVTGHTMDYSCDKVIRAGANDFIKKPFTFTEIKFKLDRIFNERRLADENKRLLNEQVVLNQKLSNILEVSRDLTAGIPFTDLFDLVVRKVSEIMEAERTSLYIIDWEKNEIWTKVAEYVDKIRMPIGEGISGKVAESGKIINVENARSLPFFNWDFDLKNDFHTRSVLCLPVYDRNQKRIGVLQVLNKKNGHHFTEYDEIVLGAMASQVAIALENSFLIDELQLSFERSIRTLSAIVDARHPLTAGHSQRVTEYSIMTAQEMGLEDDEVEVIKYAALLHDIGKIGVRDEVLLKQGAFTPEERMEMNTHPVRTGIILRNFHFPVSLRSVPVIASQHHEKINGKGYPDGLTGNELSPGSKILAVADVFDALTSQRDYSKYFRNKTLSRDPMPLSKVIQILKEDTGTHFDHDVVEAFLMCLPRVLLLYRGTHFPPEYVDDTILFMSPELLSHSQ